MEAPISPEVWRPRSVKIGVGIVVRNHFNIANPVVANWRRRLPQGAVLVVVDDGSSSPYPRADFRFDSPSGSAKARNKCLELLEDLGVTSFFLASADIFPTSSDWFSSYVSSPEPHLSYQYQEVVGPVKLHDMYELHRDSKHVAYSAQRGSLLYYDESALATVGGFDSSYTDEFLEHMDLADRIHSSGLTTWRYADVAGSENLWHSMSEKSEISKPHGPLNNMSTVTYEARKKLTLSSFIPYRDKSDAVYKVMMTSFLTSHIDTYKTKNRDPNTDVVESWLSSVERLSWDAVVFSDEIKSLSRGHGVSLVRVPGSVIMPQILPWVHVYQYLRDHEDIKWARVVPWNTPAKDITDFMSVNSLYVDSRYTSIGKSNEFKNLEDEETKAFARTHRNAELLNPHTVSGDRETVMEFAHKIVSMSNDVLTERISKNAFKSLSSDDTVFFNRVAYEVFGNRLNFLGR